MNNESFKEIEKALVSFIKRVAKGETVSEAEVAILPETVRALIELDGLL